MISCDVAPISLARMTFFCAGFILGVANVHAAPIEFDTEDAHIVVIRPVDRWSADKTTSEATLTLLKERKEGFTFADAGGRTFFGWGQAVFTFGEPKNPIIKAVDAEMKALNATPSHMAVDFINIKAPLQLRPDDMADFIEVQRALFRAMATYYGNPTTLPDRVQARKFAGGIAAAGITLLTMGKLGAATGSQVALGSGITGEADRIVRRFGLAAAPIPLPKIDFSTYKSVDVRRVVTGDEGRVGQIIIAYKADKTPEAEVAAMTQAIVKLLAIGAPIAEIEAARAEDLTKRQAIWDACVADGKCPKDN